MKMLNIILLFCVFILFINQAHGVNSSICILIDSSSKLISNPRDKEINAYLFYRENEAKKGNKLDMFSEPAMFYAILPNTKDTLTISEYLSHFNNIKMQMLNNNFSISVSWDSKIYLVEISCTMLEKDSDRTFWISFFKNIRASNAKINNIPSQITTSFNTTD